MTLPISALPISLRAGFAPATLGLAAALLAGTASLAQPAQDLVIGLPVASVANLDPHGSTALVQGNLQINAQIFDTLVGFENGQYVPSLAASWEATPDARRWTFKLREGVAFSDGSAFDATDVKASIERVVALAGPLAGLFKPISVEVVGPSEVVLSSEAGQGAMLGKLSILAMAPSEKLNDQFGLAPVGSGPFKVDSFDPNQGARLSANPNYWGANKPELASVTFRPIPEQAARTTALETGEIQLTWTVADDKVASLKSNPELKVDSVPTLANIVLWFNTKRMFGDVEVRRALWQAVDFDAIISALYTNTGARMAGPLPAAVFGASEQTPYVYDAKAAKAALEARGWDFNQTVKILMNNSTYRPLVEAIIADWARIGVKGEIDLQEPAVGTRRLLDLDWDISIIQPVITSTGDADYTLGRLYTCAANRTTYCNEDLDKLLVAAGSEPDQNKRAADYAAAGKIVWDNAVGLFPMEVKQVWAWSARLDGVVLDPIYKPDLRDVHFTR